MRDNSVRRQACAFILVCVLSAGLSGCALVETAQQLVPETEPVFEETTLWVKEDGTWTETIIEKLDQAYYDTAELKALVDETVAAFNAGYGGSSASLQKGSSGGNGTDGAGAAGAASGQSVPGDVETVSAAGRKPGEDDAASGSMPGVAVDEFSVGENGVTLKMTYKDAAAYAAYNQVPAFDGSMLEAQIEGFAFLNDFRAVSGGVSEEKTITNAVPLSHKEYQVLVTDLSHVVQVPGKIRYISANAAVEDGKTVRPRPAEEEREQEGLVLPSSAVYQSEKSAGKVSLDEQERSYLYIIYE